MRDKLVALADRLAARARPPGREPAVRRLRAGARARVGRARRPRLRREEHDADRAGRRQLRRARRAARRRRARRRPRPSAPPKPRCGTCRVVPRRVPDRRVRRRLRARRAPLHLVPHDRAPRRDPARAPRRRSAPGCSAATSARRSARSTRAPASRPIRCSRRARSSTRCPISSRSRPRARTSCASSCKRTALRRDPARRAAAQRRRRARQHRARPTRSRRSSRCSTHRAPLVRGHAVWALGQLGADAPRSTRTPTTIRSCATSSRADQASRTRADATYAATALDLRVAERARERRHQLVLRAGADLLLDERGRDPRAQLGDVRSRTPSRATIAAVGLPVGPWHVAHSVANSSAPSTELRRRRSRAHAATTTHERGSTASPGRCATWAVPGNPVLCLAACGGLSSLAARRRCACGGPQSSDAQRLQEREAKPWKKPKALKFDDKIEAKADGELVVPGLRRARWFRSICPRTASSTLKLEITPPGDAVNDDFDLGVEVLDPGYPRDQQVRSRGRRRRRARRRPRRCYDLEPGKYLHPPLPAGPHGHRRLRAARHVQAHRARRGEERLPRRRSRSSRRCRWCRCKTTRRRTTSRRRAARS